MDVKMRRTGGHNGNVAEVERVEDTPYNPATEMADGIARRQNRADCGWLPSM